MADIPGYAVIRWQESIMYQFLGHRSGDKRPLYQIQQDARTAGITIPHRTRWVNDWSWIRQKVKEYNQSTRDRFRYREADVGQQEPRVPIAQRQKELSRVQMRRLAGRLIRQRKPIHCLVGIEMPFPGSKSLTACFAVGQESGFARTLAGVSTISTSSRTRSWTVAGQISMEPLIFLQTTHPHILQGPSTIY